MAEQKSRVNRKRQDKVNNVKPKRSSLIKKIILFICIIGVIAAIGTTVVFYKWIQDAPKIDAALLKDPISSKIYDKNGEIYTEVGAQSREYIPYKDIPKQVEEALLATEDVRFYKHHGIDVIRLISAVLGNLQNGFGSEGASTLTQQVVKLSFLTPEKTIKRKVQEMAIAYKLENKYTKHQILEMYFNKVNMSEGAYGIGTGARVYFDKPLADLSLPEIAFLVGMPQSPNNYNPYVNPDLANKRKNTVLLLMKNAEVISNEEMKTAQAVDITTLLIPENSDPIKKRQNTAFVDQVINEVQALNRFDIYTDGLNIYTTIDPNAQDYLDKILDSGELVAFPNDEIQAGVTLLDTKTGEVRALGGGRKQTVARGFNYATDLKSRQPGSTIKPILDYGPAVEYKKWSTYQQIVDEPYTYSNGQKITNATGNYKGKVSIRTALEKSLNIPAVKTFQAVGTEKAHGFAKNLGIDLDNPIYESAAIGGVSNGPSPYKLAAAYAAFGNGGTYNAPHTITKIVTREATEEIDMTPKGRTAMKPATAFLITDMLKGVVQPGGTGVNGAVAGVAIAAKTGTTNYTEDDKKKYNIPANGVPDSWFVGYSTNYTASVWVGYSDRKNYIDGASQKLPAEIFRTLMSEISKTVENTDFPVPNTAVQLPILIGSDPPTIAPEGTPESAITYEYFIKGTEPQAKTVTQQQTGETTLNAQYDETTKKINLTWSFSNGTAHPEYELSQKIDGGALTVLTKTNETLYVIDTPIPGATYEFTLDTFLDNSKIHSATASVVIPKENKTENENKPDDNTNTNPTDDKKEPDQDETEGNNDVTIDPENPTNTNPTDDTNPDNNTTNPSTNNGATPNDDTNKKPNSNNTPRNSNEEQRLLDIPDFLRPQ